ncbi:MAG: hypothetical protein VKP62_08665 [Candidatus Sericytochromatia bacterium]|nr:hypothetical protein [Candidatus Sericytochromatia bacterium]
MLGTMFVLMLVTTAVQGFRNWRTYQAYQRGLTTRGQLVNQTTTTGLMSAGTLALAIAARLMG